MEGRFSGTTVALIAVATLLMGVLIGVGLMTFLRPSAETVETAASTTEDTAAPAESAEEPAPSASAAPATPPADAAAIAAANKLFELRKKVKGRRAKQLDPQCVKLFKKQYPVGYAYDGGKFEENQYVANASGCVAMAKASKAPWFCCPR